MAEGGWQVVTDGDHGNPLLQQKKCNVRVDLGFLLDSSGSIRYDYQKEKVSTGQRPLNKRTDVSQNRGGSGVQNVLFDVGCNVFIR